MPLGNTPFTHENVNSGECDYLVRGQVPGPWLESLWRPRPTQKVSTLDPPVTSSRDGAKIREHQMTKREM